MLCAIESHSFLVPVMCDINDVHEASQFNSHLFRRFSTFCRDCGWRSVDSVPLDADPCSVCLERRCTVAADGKLSPFLCSTL